MASARMTIPWAFSLRNARQKATLYRTNFWHRELSATAPTLRVSGAVPKFGPTSNPDLDKLLQDMRENHFLAVHLTQVDYRTVFRQKNHASLRDNPISVEIEGESFKLTPKINIPGIPLAKFKKALELMKEPSDFDVLPELIRGYNEMSEGHQPLAPPTSEKMGRRLNSAGRTDLIMKIAHDAEKLHFKFSRTSARIFMHGLRKKQLKVTAREEALKELKHARQLLAVVGKREICIEKTKRFSEDNIILGTVLSMFAEYSLKFNNGKDHEGCTKEFALELQRFWTGPEPTELVRYMGGVSMTKARGSLLHCKHQLINWKPVLEGLIQAKSVLADSELSPWLATTSESLAGNIAYWGEFFEKNIYTCWPERQRGYMNPRLQVLKVPGEKPVEEKPVEG